VALRAIISFTGCFTGCDRLEAAMTFDLICRETFRDAWSEPDHPHIARIAAWSGVKDLSCWVFETNATASVIRIIARHAAIIPVP